MQYWLSFAGFFPADNPLYTCLVCIKKSGLPASGGGMSGVVFHHISEGVMAQHLKLDVRDAHDTTSVVIPDVKSGDIVAANYVLKHLGIKTNANWDGDYITGNPIWGTCRRESNSVAMTAVKGSEGVMPDVTGMGARDAVYLLESRGLKVKLQGRGKVRTQSLAYGKPIAKSNVCVLTLN